MEALRTKLGGPLAEKNKTILALQEKNAELLKEFRDKVLPVVEEVRKERGLWIVFALGDQSNIAAANAGLDLSLDVIKRLDSSK